MIRKWMLAFPRQGKWFHVTNLLDAGTIYKYAKDHVISHHVAVYSICNNDFRRFKVETESNVKTMFAYLRNNIGTDDLKLRVKVKERSF